MNKLFDFIEKSKTAYHCIGEVEKQLQDAGFVRLYENVVWDEVKSQGAYYVIRNDASMIAFTMPKEKPVNFHIVAAHSDSPAWKIKESPELSVDGAYVKLNVEKYGGMILSTWLDRVLGIAGRVVVKENEKFVSKLVDLGPDMCVIPNVSVHFNREINKGYEYNAQTDMLPLYSADCKDKVAEKIAKEIGIAKEEILGSDLYLYQGQRGQVFGNNKEFVLAPRLDDLMCVYGGLQALLQIKKEKAYTTGQVNMLAIFHNEEVGSRTIQGADSDFLKHILQKIGATIGCNDVSDLYSDSFVLSADNAHGLHPNHPEKSDLTNKPVLNGGVVLKFHGNAQYMTDAYSAAVVRDLAKQAEVKLQDFANRSDIAGGSTLGNILVSQVSIPGADIGLAQLAMHSAMETAGAHDMTDLIKLLCRFYAPLSS